ncbi:Uncharacterised protein [Xylophilus ampelinus]|nr:hypothetical protein [Variovorax sp.]VTY26029.1 Uncharacterised protein [Xylophilus ampelinus]|tara:strand:- start:923 stop:1306 length:384 start_codon:yes stop_codon:yes gene_type:complete
MQPRPGGAADIDAKAMRLKEVARWLTDWKDAHRRHSGSAFLLRRLLWAYAGAGALALLLVPVSAHGWMGSRADALAALYTLVLALPWTPLLLLVPGNSAWAGAALLASAIALNVWAGLTVLRWIEDR